MPKRMDPEKAKRIREKFGNDIGGGDSSNNTVIDLNKQSKVYGRIIPQETDLPGGRLIQIWPQIKGLKKPTVSLKTFGYRDPVLELREKQMNRGKKATVEKLQKEVQVSRQVWVGIIDRENPGDAKNPFIRILPFRKDPWDTLVSRLMGEDDDEDGIDITDPYEGRDFKYTKKEVKGQTKHILKFKDEDSALSDDEDYLNAVLQASQEFDVLEHMWTPRWDVLNAVYYHLSGGDEIPDEYLEQISDDDPYMDKPDREDLEWDDDDEGDDDDDEEDDEDDEEEEVKSKKKRSKKKSSSKKSSSKKKAKDDDDDEDEEEEEDEDNEVETGDEDDESDEAEEEEDEGDDESVSDDGEGDSESDASEYLEWPVGKRVKFEDDDGNEVKAKVTGHDFDEEEVAYYVVESDDGEEYDAYPDDLEEVKEQKKKSAKKASKKKTTKKKASEKMSKKK